MLATSLIAAGILNSHATLENTQALRRLELSAQHRNHTQRLTALAYAIDDLPEGPERNIARMHFTEALRLVKDTYTQLVQGSPALGLSPASPHLRQYLFGPIETYDNQLNQTVADAQLFLQNHRMNTPASLTAGRDHHTQINSWANGALGQAQESLAAEIQREAVENAENGQNLHMAVLFGSLALLSVTGLYILRVILLQTAKVLREHLAIQRRLIAIINSVEDAILEVNPTGEIVFANRSASRTMGQSPSQLTETTLQVLTRLAGSDGSRVLEALAHDDQVSTTSILLSRADGTCFRAALNLTPIEGQPRAIVTFRDVTRHLHREERLRKLSHAVEHSPAPVIITDFTGVIEYVNPAFTTVSGWSAKEVIGHSPRMISSGQQSTTLYRSMWEQLKAGNSWRGEFRNRRKDGGSYWVRSAIAPIMDDQGTITHFVAVQEDVTTELLALEELETSRRRLREAIDSLPQGFAIYGADEQLEMCNDAYRQLYAPASEHIREGKTFTNILESGLDYGVFTLPEQTPEARAHFISSRQALFRQGGEREVALHNGHWVLASETITPSGAHVCLRTDITEIKRIQQELEAARAHADQANTAKSQFLSSMSHELRTPLNAILGFAQVLQMNRKTPLNERQSEQVQQILSAGQHLLSLIDEILDLAKIEAGKIRLHMGPVDVFTTAHDCQTLIQPMADAARLAMAVHVNVDSPRYVQADQTRLKQILLNLLSNAVKYNKPEGKLWLNIDDSQPPPVGATGAWTTFSVSDTGLGIPEEARHQLFQPFSRLGRDAMMIEGTGIGLALTKQLIEMMGGELIVTHIPSGGTCFSFALPQTSPPL